MNIIKPNRIKDRLQKLLDINNAARETHVSRAATQQYATDKIHEAQPMDDDDLMALWYLQVWEANRYGIH
jgi:hypothetical protein